MRQESVINFINSIGSYSQHSDNISFEVRKKLINLLKEIGDNGDNCNTEFMVSTIVENGKFKYKEDKEDYYDFIEKICQRIDPDLYHALGAAYEKNLPGVIFDHIDRDNPSIKKGEIIAVKNHLQVNKYYINPLSQPIPRGHITGTEFCKYIQLSKIMNSIYEGKSYHQIYIQKIINCIIFIIGSNNNTENIFNTPGPGFDLCIPKEEFYNRIEELAYLQSESVTDISNGKLNMDLVASKLKTIKKDLYAYIKNKEDRYIPEAERIEIETNELIEQANANEGIHENEALFDRINSNIITYRKGTAIKRTNYKYKIT